MLTINKLKDQIYDCKRLSHEEKDNAISDLDFMETSKLYSDRVHYDKNIHYYSSILDMFSLSKSILGWSFWTNIINKI